MARYVCLIRYSQQGVKNIKQSPSRGAAFRKAAEKAGVTVETQLWTAGTCDGILVLSGEEKKVLGAITKLASLGNVHTQSMPAFDAAEFAEIVK
jgi:uncharacterized protein with GYD domain